MKKYSTTPFSNHDQGSIFYWLTSSSIEETRHYAPQASNETLFRALKREKRAGAIAAIKRELFARLERGDSVKSGAHIYRVEWKTQNDKYVKLDKIAGRWSWKDFDFIED